MKNFLNFKGILFVLLFFTTNLAFAQPNCQVAINVSLNPAGEAVIPADLVFEHEEFTSLSISKDGTNFSESIMFDCSELGDNNVTVVGIIDGIEHTCESVITVEDKLLPVAIVDAGFLITLTSETDTYTLQPSDINEGSYDNCGIVSYVLSQTEFTIDHLGENTVTLTVMDDSGNENQAWTYVTVIADGFVPPFACNELTVALPPFGGNYFLHASNFIPNGDQYDVTSISVDGGASYSTYIVLNCDDVSDTPQDVLIVAYLNSEEFTCTSTYTVVDNIAPIAVAEASITLTLNADGEATLTPEMVDEGSYDNCSDLTFELSQTDFTTADLGTNTVMMTVYDATGNASQVWTTVLVTDGSLCNLPFNIVWPADIIINDANVTGLDVSPQELEDNFGYDYGDVNPTYPDICDYITAAYSDVIIENQSGIKVIRTWIVFDWEVENTITYNQIININGFSGEALACVSGLSVNIAAGDVTLSPSDVTVSYDGSIADLTLFIVEEDDTPIPGNIITSAYAGQTLTYIVFNENNEDNCWGYITVIGDNSNCFVNDDDIAWPSAQIEISNPDQDPALLTPATLTADYGFGPSEVNAIIDNDCAIVGINYSDEIFNHTGGYFHIVRTFVLVDWLTWNGVNGSNGYWTFTQIINNGVDPLSLICDILPRTADVGDCDSGHTLADDVEWPADIAIADHRITPDELVDFSAIDVLDANPSFYNTPEDYTTTYTDLLVGLTTEEITVGRVWMVTNTAYNLNWTYSQEIVIDMTNFSDLVTVNTTGLRPMQNVNINDLFLTNENGASYVSDATINSISFDDAVNNGINILDVVLMSHYLLEEIDFAPIQLTIGDANQDAEITQADVTAVKNMILLSDDDGWTFVDETENLGATATPKAHYVAFKRGDVNDSALLLGESLNISNASQFTFNDELVNAGESYEIPVYLNTAKDAYGLEFHIQVDESMLTIDNISSDYFNGDISWNVNENGLVLLTHSQLVNEIIGGDVPVFTIHATAVSNGVLSQAFDFENKLAHIATTDYELISVTGNLTNTITSTRDEILSVVKVYPNPASKFILIDNNKLTLTGDFAFELRSTAGQSVLKEVNQNKIDISTLPAGMYFYTITMDGYELTKKIAINR